jgi:hypothetical protein
MHPGEDETGSDTGEGMRWFDTLLAARPRTYARWFLVVGLVGGCIFAIASFALVAFAFPDLPSDTGLALAVAGWAFLGVAGPCLIAVPFFLLLDMLRTTKGEFWSPFAGAAVRDICAHLTRDEKARLRRMGAQVGLLAGAVMAAAGILAPAGLRCAIPAVIALILLVGLLVWARGKKIKRFLASTEYATKAGIQPGDIRFVAPWHRAQSRNSTSGNS